MTDICILTSVNYILFYINEFIVVIYEALNSNSNPSIIFIFKVQNVIQNTFNNKKREESQKIARNLLNTSCSTYIRIHYSIETFLALIGQSTFN